MNNTFNTIMNHFGFDSVLSNSHMNWEFTNKHNNKITVGRGVMAAIASNGEAIDLAKKLLRINPAHEYVSTAIKTSNTKDFIIHWEKSTAGDLRIDIIDFSNSLTINEALESVATSLKTPLYFCPGSRQIIDSQCAFLVKGTDGVVGIYVETPV